MASKDSHISNQELLLVADGEMPALRTTHIREHLATCRECRIRMAEIEATLADFVRGRGEMFDSQLPPIAGPRALLRAQLAQLASEPAAHSRSWFSFPLATAVAAICTVFLAAAMVGTHILQRSTVWETDARSTAIERGTVPNPRLTPGATRSVGIGDVCSMPHEEVTREVSPSMRERVLREYGIANAHPGDYEIDYLIAPGLGGTDDIRNLWPEPYKSRTWNASVKDALEEHLHQLVCTHELDLSTAQQEIAENWIAVYKKYFHTNQPLSHYS